jgi:hypothetical protein
MSTIATEQEGHLLVCNVPAGFPVPCCMIAQRSTACEHPHIWSPFVGLHLPFALPLPLGNALLAPRGPSLVWVEVKPISRVRHRVSGQRVWSVLPAQFPLHCLLLRQSPQALPFPLVPLPDSRFCWMLAPCCPCRSDGLGGGGGMGARGCWIEVWRYTDQYSYSCTLQGEHK